MKGLMKWSLVAVVFAGLALAMTPSVEAGRRVRYRYPRPVYTHYYAAPVVVRARPVPPVYVRAPRVYVAHPPVLPPPVWVPHPPVPPAPVYVPHPPVPPHAVHVTPPGVHVYFGTRYGPRVIRP